MAAQQTNLESKCYWFAHKYLYRIYLEVWNVVDVPEETRFNQSINQNLEFSSFSVNHTNFAIQKNYYNMKLHFLIKVE